MWLTVLATLFLVFLCNRFWSKRRFYYLSWRMHGPFSWPFIGNALEFIDTTKTISNITRLCNTYSSPFRFWMSGKFVVFFDRPEEIETILTSSVAMDKGQSYDQLKYVIGGHGLFTSGGETWKQHRKLLNPTLQNPNILKSFYPNFNKNLRRMVKLLEHNVGKGFFDIYEFIEACTLNMILETTFGVSANFEDVVNLSLLESVANLMLTAGVLIFQPWYQWKPLLRFTKYYNMIVKSRNEATSFARKCKLCDQDCPTEYMLKQHVYDHVQFLRHCETCNIVILNKEYYVFHMQAFKPDIIPILDQKMAEFKNATKNEEMKNESNELDEFGKKRSNIFIDECVRLSIQRQCFSETDIIIESITIMSGGFETNALTGSYIILMLALHPNLQEKVFQEIHDIFPDQSSDISADDISKLDYTNRFIKEVMRFTPIVPLITRKAKEDMQIGKYTIPAGTELIVPVFNLHRNPLVWGETANVFDPDHFLPEAIVGKHPYSFLEFGGGPRICIGMKYAKIVTRLLVCWLVRNYRFTTDLKIEQLHFRMNVTMKLLEKHMVHIHKREIY